MDAKQYCHENLIDLATEILEWHNTGCNKGSKGKLHILASMLSLIDSDARFMIAESLIKDECLKILIERERNKYKGQRCLCLTCVHLPRLKPCKTLTGSTMQYTGICDKRLSNFEATSLWVDFETQEAWEDGDYNITKCEAYLDWVIESRGGQHV